MITVNPFPGSALALLLISALPVQAATLSLSDNGIYTSDVLTGLDWLDVTETQGRSQVEVINGIASGAITPGGMSLSGWRYATGTEITTLLSASGGIPSTFPCTADACYEERTLFALESYLGFTRATDSTTGLYVPVPDNPSEFDIYSYKVQGFTADIQLAATNQYQSDKFWTAGFETDSTADGILSVDIFQEHQYSFYDYQSASYLGSFLVRESASLSAVPLPAALWLFAGGLSGLMVVARRKR